MKNDGIFDGIGKKLKKYYNIFQYVIALVRVSPRPRKVSKALRGLAFGAAGFWACPLHCP